MSTHRFASKWLVLNALAIGLVTLPASSFLSAQNGAKLSSDDSTFVTDAMEGGQAEVDFAKVALTKSKNAEVRGFANRMIKDHSKANTKLKSIAMTKGIKPSTGIGIANNAELLKLKALSGDTFDKSYVDLMVEDHKKDVSDFEKESMSSSDESLKGFAKDTLPTLQEHYKMIQSLQAKMK